MHKTILAATLATLTTGAAADTKLTVYSGDFDAVSQSTAMPGMPGFALVRQASSLVPGADGTLTMSGLPAAIDAAGVRLTPHGGNARVTGQRFDFALGDSSELLRRAVGQSVDVTYTAGNELRSVSGTLIAASDGLSLQSGNRVVVLRDYDSFSLASMPDGLRAQPTLRFSVDGARGAGDYVLDYPTGGLAWRAEYLATLEGDCRMDFTGAAHVVNRSGASFDDAQLTLVAGQPNLQPAAGAPQPAMYKTQMLAMAADAAPQPQASGEYHAYTLPERIDVPNGSVQRVPLLDDVHGATCARRYVARSPMGYFRPSNPIVDPNFGAEGEVPVIATLQFANTQATKLGRPLPAGRLRVFTGENFLGEAAIAHTPEGREVKADLGQAFDLTATRTRKDLQLDTDRLGLLERVQIVLSNAKHEAVTVRVEEALPRWSEWKIVESSARWKQQDAQTAVFDVPVPAAGDVTVSYAVRYRWPESMKPL